MTQYPGYKKCYLDTETTGTDRKLNDIFQISGMIVDLDGTVLDEFDFKMMPFSLEHVDAQALEKTGMTVQKLCEFGDPRKAYAAFVEVLEKHVDRYNKKDKMQFVAYNAKFDEDFMREFFAKNDDTYFGSWFWNPSICVMQQAASFLIDVRGALPNFQLGTICEAAGLGWNADMAHDALYDVHKTHELHNYLNENSAKLGQ